jgi:hypothetical protein
MKNFINFLLASYAIFYTLYYVDAGDICRTIFGCMMILMCYWIIRKEN